MRYARASFGGSGKPPPFLILLYQNLPENQCIFVRGFRVARVLKIWPRLRGAGPTPDIGGYGPGPASDRQLVVEPIGSPAGTDVKSTFICLFFLQFFNVSNYQDPLHVLLQFIAEVSNSMDCRPCLHDGS